MIADDPAAFASAIERLVDDRPLWHRLEKQGRAHIIATHGREVVRKSLTEALAGVMEKNPCGAVSLSTLWRSHKLSGRMHRAKVRLKHLVRTVLIRAHQMHTCIALLLDGEDKHGTRATTRHS